MTAGPGNSANINEGQGWKHMPGGLEGFSGKKRN